MIHTSTYCNGEFLHKKGLKALNKVSSPVKYVFKTLKGISPTGKSAAKAINGVSPSGKYAVKPLNGVSPGGESFVKGILLKNLNVFIINHII